MSNDDDLCYNCRAEDEIMKRTNHTSQQQPEITSQKHQTDEVDLKRPCKSHFGSTLQQHRIDEVDLKRPCKPQFGSTLQRRKVQIECTLPRQQQVCNHNYWSSDCLRFGHRGERNSLCSMCVCRWVNTRIY
jgi:hypothetical protein